MKNEEVISMISKQMPGMVHVSDPEAYKAFGEGRCIYDLDRHGLEGFSRRNWAEFGDWIVGGPSGPFPKIPEVLPAVAIYVTYHKHKAPEEIVRRLLWPAGQ